MSIRRPTTRIGWAVVWASVYLLRAVLYLVPKAPNRVIIAGYRDEFSGNNRALFEQLQALPHLVAYFWTASHPRQAELSLRFPGRVLRGISPRALWAFARAANVVVSHSTAQTFPYHLIVRRVRWLYLPHGVPMKTVGLAEPKSIPASWAKEHARYAQVLCCSTFEGDLWVRAFGIPKERVAVVGYPRNRTFSEPAGDRPDVLPSGPLILYAPTYRDGGAQGGIEQIPGMDLDALQEFLERLGATLLVRAHYFDETPSYQHARIVAMGSDRFPDMNRLLKHVDVLITDYSSSWIDFLLLDRPIIFAWHDFDEYARERDFMFDPKAVAPGAQVRDYDELIAALKSSLADDAFASARQAARTKFHRYVDGDAATRIAQLLLR